MNKILVVYYSSTGNTQQMAEQIVQGITSAGGEADLVEVNAAPAIDGYEKIAFGCPAMGAENLEEAEFEPFFASIEGQLSGKKVALFGSYDWGDGQWMRDWQDRVLADGANLFNNEGLIVNGTPDAEGDALCNKFGSDFSKF